MNEAKSTRFQRMRRRAVVWAWASAGGTLALLALSPLSVGLQHWAESAGATAPAPLGPTLALMVFVLSTVTLWKLATLPAVLYLNRMVEGAYRRPGGAGASLVVSELSSFGLALLLATAAAAVVQLSAAFVGGWWWLLSSLSLAAGIALALRAGPVLLGQVGQVRPLTRPGLADTLSAVVQAARVPVEGVYEWGVGGQTGATALVTGVGRGRRVLVADDVIRRWSVEEVAVVVAHELAHLANNDLWRAAALDAVILAAGLFTAHLALPIAAGQSGSAGPGSLATLPLIACVAGAVWLLATPIRHAQSRRHERRADAFALECTGEADAFGVAVRRLAAERLVEDDPSSVTRWLFHRHPSVAERLAVAEAYKKTEPRLRGPVR